MRRGISVAALATVVALTATACGGSDSEDKAAKEPGEVSGTVTWWDTSDNTSEAPAFKKLIADFEKKYPKVKVKYVNVPFAQAQQKFKTAAQSGKGAPDVLRSDVGWTPGFAKLGYLAALDGTPALDDKDKFLDGPAASGGYEGKTYGVPQVTDTLGLLYNKELLEKAGVKEAPATWTEVKDAAKKIEKKTGADGIYLNPDSYFALPFVYGEGGDMVDVEGKKITIANDAAVKGVSTAVDLIKSGAAPKPDTTDGYNNMQTSFKDGKVAMIVNGPWATADIFSGKSFKNKENLGIAPVPAGSTGEAGAPVGGHNLVAYAGSGNLDASYLFIKHMTSAKAQEQVSAEIGVLPTREDAYTDKVLSDPVRKAFYDALGKAHPRPAIAEGGDLFTDFLPHYVKILQGTETPEEGLTATADAWKKQLLKDYTVEK
ncbi:extracellular solute-binding protein [Streptomyces sp. SCUT-3]|uniref:extracellular solute-binding protein n=1 Tax=Streptomyces sp. SCUT-3 TaxID=2684469 RepID=UPI000CABCB93|nr:extracellular solute-binding protein [Streptomyces sp. SCUT-3]PLW74597.1 sugar ABC transporter substrate-binding protein [Streptomyces sp. DJ]QMV23717.1 extracellular solute-binding protein [Streptomyces sp. SCUT-3]